LLSLSLSRADCHCLVLFIAPSPLSLSLSPSLLLSLLLVISISGNGFVPDYLCENLLSLSLILILSITKLQIYSSCLSWYWLTPSRLMASADIKIAPYCISTISVFTVQQRNEDLLLRRGLATRCRFGTFDSSKAFTTAFGIVLSNKTLTHVQITNRPMCGLLLFFEKVFVPPSLRLKEAFCCHNNKAPRTKVIN